MTKLAASGDHKALNEVGTRLMGFRDMPDMLTKGLQMFTRAADSGSIMGCFNLGICLFFGHGTPANMEEGMSLWAKGRSLFEKSKNTDWLKQACVGRVLPVTKVDLSSLFTSHLSLSCFYVYYLVLFYLFNFCRSSYWRNRRHGNWSPNEVESSSPDS